MSCVVLEEYGLCYHRECGLQWKAGMMWERALIPLLPSTVVCFGSFTSDQWINPELCI